MKNYLRFKKLKIVCYAWDKGLKAENLEREGYN